MGLSSQQTEPQSVSVCSMPVSRQDPNVCVRSMALSSQQTESQFACLQNTLCSHQTGPHCRCLQYNSEVSPNGTSVCVSAVWLRVLSRQDFSVSVCSMALGSQQKGPQCLCPEYAYGPEFSSKRTSVSVSGVSYHGEKERTTAPLTHPPFLPSCPE